MKITKFFRHYQIRDDKRLFLATQALEGEALDWLVWMEEEGSLESWGDFIQDFIQDVLGEILMIFLRAG